MNAEPAWSWADYEACAAEWERATGDVAAHVLPQGTPDAADADETAAPAVERPGGDGSQAVAPDETPMPGDSAWQPERIGRNTRPGAPSPTAAKAAPDQLERPRATDDDRATGEAAGVAPAPADDFRGTDVVAAAPPPTEVPTARRREEAVASHGAASIEQHAPRSTELPAPHGAVAEQPPHCSRGAPPAAPAGAAKAGAPESRQMRRARAMVEQGFSTHEICLAVRLTDEERRLLEADA